MAPGFVQGLNKRKRSTVEFVKDEEDKEIYLSLALSHAEGIGKDSSMEKGFYCIYVWLDQHVRFWTSITEGLQNPTWNERFYVPLGKSPKYEYLYLEIYRVESNSDPGTSNGDVLIGRTRIPLPNGVNCKKTGRYGVVLPNGTGCSVEGYIALAMELKHNYT